MGTLEAGAWFHCEGKLGKCGSMRFLCRILFIYVILEFIGLVFWVSLLFLNSIDAFSSILIHNLASG